MKLLKKLLMLSVTVVCLKAEHTFSYDAYALGATGTNVNYKYYIGEDFFIKAGMGSESLDVYSGTVKYDYELYSLGYYMFDFYYKKPTNKTLSGGYTDVSPYAGLDIVFESRSKGWNFGFIAGFFDSPKISHDGSCCLDNSVIGMTIGFRVSYSFGKIKHHNIDERNNKTMRILHALGGASESFNNNYKPSTIKAYYGNSYNSNSNNKRTMSSPNNRIIRGDKNYLNMKSDEYIYGKNNSFQGSRPGDSDYSDREMNYLINGR